MKSKKTLMWVFGVFTALLVAFTVWGVLAANGHFADYTLRVYVTEEYYDKFDVKGFTLEDFEGVQVREFTYWIHQYAYTNESGIAQTETNARHFRLHLKTIGKGNAEKAIEDLEKLAFVKRAIFYTSVVPGTQL